MPCVNGKINMMFAYFCLVFNFSAVEKGKEVIVPLVINTYNNMMDGVDQSDQMINSYPVKHKRLKNGIRKYGFILSILLHSMLIYYIKRKVPNRDHESFIKVNFTNY